MQAVRAYYDGRAFVPITPVKIMTNQSAIITILDEEKKSTPSKSNDKFFGILSDEDYHDISEALLETQRTDSDEW